MKTTSYMRGLAVVGLCALPSIAFAEIEISDAYARVSHPGAPTAAAFMMIRNTSDQEDVLVGVKSEVAARVELHTHIDQGDGIMKMTQIEKGIPIPAGGMHMMQRGGDHVMFMGLVDSLRQGGAVEVTLVFETAGDLRVMIPVDNERKPGHGGHGH